MSGLTWVEKFGRGADGERFHYSYMVDGEDRALARIDHPLGDYLLYTCNLYFSPSGSSDGKPTYEEDRAYIELEVARRYCEQAASKRKDL